MATTSGLADRIDIFEIEQFVALNLYEIGKFAAGPGRKLPWTHGEAVQRNRRRIRDRSKPENRTTEMKETPKARQAASWRAVKTGQRR